jgi:hypothetical protein
MLHGIFYNAPKADCSIYESGKMCYEALKLSEKYLLDYSETSDKVEGDFDFVVFNHHPWVNTWMVNRINDFPGKTFTIVTEVGHDGHVMPWTPPVFQHYIILDPTIIDTENIHGFSRPLELYKTRKKENEQLVIGSLGFPTKGKNWEEIITRTQEEFDEALIRFHIPNATYVPNSQYEIDKIVFSCVSLIRKPKINIEFTHHYMDKNQLIEWCSQNTINVFLYNRNQSGLAATTDQAIIAERPIYVSQNPTFRHILQYLHPYPQTIGEAIKTTLPAVRQMKKDWSPLEFAIKFESILLEESHEI